MNAGGSVCGREPPAPRQQWASGCANLMAAALPRMLLCAEEKGPTPDLNPRECPARQVQPPTPTPGTVTRDDVLRAESDLDTTRHRWVRAGRVRVAPGDVPAAEERVRTLAAEWHKIEAARLPVDRLADVEADARAAKHRLRRQAATLTLLRARSWFWGYSAFVHRVLGVEPHQLWALSLVNGLAVVLCGWGMAAFGMLAAVGFTATALGTLAPMLRASRSGLGVIRADLQYRTAVHRARLTDSRRELTELQTRCGDLRRALRVRRHLDRARVVRLRENAACQAEYDRAVGELKRLKQILGDVLYDLLATDWRGLRDVPFEDFLVRVFRSLGYQVRTTKRTGDQGVDLILTRPGRRLAVQAKGYAGSVGNDAVQQAHTGTVFYGCTECAVITNSRFTRGAEELARRVGCVLVDEHGITALINGRVF